jgi:hypothetical protein
MTLAVEPASFRDLSGYVFTKDGTFYRRVNTRYRRHYELLTESGLYQELVDDGLLVPHEEIDPTLDFPSDSECYRVLRPDQLTTISYPYEWCFSQLQDAALATLRIQDASLRRGMWLKDASAYNIQFRNGKPVLIDTLSFAVYEEGSPWPAYRQFCEHFLAPLALMSRTDVRLSQLLRTNLDGIPLDLAARLLPGSTRLDAGLLTHLHLHGAAQKRYEGRQIASAASSGRFSRTALLGLIDSLEGTVRKLAWKPAGTVWGDYYSSTNYTDRAMTDKRRIVGEMLRAIEPSPRKVWDLGANTGSFTRLAAEMGAETVAWDIDPAAVEKNYLDCRTAGESRILPLLVDLTNPSPGLGWELNERRSMTSRGPADVALALALVHHLAIGNNVPLSRVAQFMRSIGNWLIVEFVPKSDSQVQRLLASREDVYTDYSQARFEQDFLGSFEIVREVPVGDSERTVYLMMGR